jgi:hypothetical protein
VALPRDSKVIFIFLFLCPQSFSVNSHVSRMISEVQVNMQVYGVARTVVERAADMMDDLDMTQDISDSS